MPRPRRLACRANAPIVSETYKPMAGKLLNCSGPDETGDCEFEPPCSNRLRVRTADRVALFHYVTKSEAEWAAKVKWGSGTGVHRNGHHKELFTRCALSKMARTLKEKSVSRAISPSGARDIAAASPCGIVRPPASLLCFPLGTLAHAQQQGCDELSSLAPCMYVHTPSATIPRHLRSAYSVTSSA